MSVTDQKLKKNKKDLVAHLAGQASRESTGFRNDRRQQNFKVTALPKFSDVRISHLLDVVWPPSLM